MLVALLQLSDWKSNITPSLILAAEVGARYTFTDNLDASNPNENLKHCDLAINNDWYIFLVYINHTIK
jgi:hypothetical protein